MKYVIVEDGVEGLEMPTAYIFPEYVAHNSVTNRLKRKVIGAGFCKLQLSTIEGTIDCECEASWVSYGESTSLKLKSRGEADNRILNQGMRR